MLSSESASLTSTPYGASRSAASARFGAYPSVAATRGGQSSRISSSRSPPPVPRSSKLLAPCISLRTRSAYDQGGSSSIQRPARCEKSHPANGSVSSRSHSAIKASRFISLSPLLTPIVCLTLPRIIHLSPSFSSHAHVRAGARPRASRGTPTCPLPGSPPLPGSLSPRRLSVSTVARRSFTAPPTIAVRRARDVFPRPPQRAVLRQCAQNLLQSPSCTFHSSVRGTYGFIPATKHTS